MKKKKVVFITSGFLLFFLLVFSCAKDVGKVPPPAIVDCDTISYAQDIAPIIAQSCSIVDCHVSPNPPNGILLGTYDELKTQAENGSIQKRVIDGNPSFMPPTGQLNSLQTAYISCWLSNGYKP